MDIRLLDYSDFEVIVDIGDIENVVRMTINVITGDEVLSVVYRDGSERTFDSSDCRIIDYYDELYDIYNIETGTNLLNDVKFITRTNSYWRGEELT